MTQGLPALLRTFALAATTAPAAWSLQDATHVPTPPPEVVRFVEALDRTFNQEDFEAYRALFRPLHPAVDEGPLQTARTLMEGPGPRPVRRTHILSVRPYSKGHVVEARVLFAGGTDPEAPTVVCRETLAVEYQGQGQSLCVLHVEICPVLAAMVREGTFACPGCDWRVASPGPDWLLRPSPAHEGGCHETVVLYHLTLAVQVEATVQVAAEDLSPEQALAAAARGILALPKTAPRPLLRAASRLLEHLPGRIEPWVPQGLAEGSGARVFLDLGGLGPALGLPEAAHLHLARRGRVRYLLAALADRSVLEEARDDVERILASFVFGDPGLDPEDLAASIARGHHGEALFDGNRYVNPTAGVAIEGPEGFEPSAVVAPADFAALWRRKSGDCFLQVVGLRTAGREWTAGAAADYLTRILAERRAALAQGARLAASATAAAAVARGRPALLLEYSIQDPVHGSLQGFLGAAWCGALLVWAEGRTSGVDAEETLQAFRRSFLTLQLPR